MPWPDQLGQAGHARGQRGQRVATENLQLGQEGQAVLGGGARRRPGSAAVVGGAVDSFIQRPPSDAELNSPGRPHDDG